jgi:hypothetical protein
MENNEPINNPQVKIDWDLYQKLKKLGIIPSEERLYNIGKSDYSQHTIQPWSIWIDYDLDPWDADIVKRVLRTKKGESRIMDYEKIIHICNEKIRQLKNENRNNEGNVLD